MDGWNSSENLPLPVQRSVNERRLPKFLLVFLTEVCQTVVLIVIEWIYSSLPSKKDWGLDLWSRFVEDWIMQDLQCRDTLQCPHVLHHQGSPVSTNLQGRSGFSGLLGRIQERKKTHLWVWFAHCWVSGGNLGDTESSLASMKTWASRLIQWAVGLRQTGAGLRSMGESPYHTEINSGNLEMSLEKNTGISNSLKREDTSQQFSPNTCPRGSVREVAHDSLSVHDASRRTDWKTSVVSCGLAAAPVRWGFVSRCLWGCNRKTNCQSRSRSRASRTRQSPLRWHDCFQTELDNHRLVGWKGLWTRRIPTALPAWSWPVA